ncbi:hypothetical protein MRX96_009017 [Rhipicephalus microplus]
MDIYALLIPGVIIVPDERDVTRNNGLLLGPAAKPPLVKFLTIGERRERFAPNPNEDGMISLSLSWGRGRDPCGTLLSTA